MSTRSKYLTFGILVGLVLGGIALYLHPNCGYVATPAPAGAGADATGDSGQADSGSTG